MGPLRPVSLLNRLVSEQFCYSGDLLSLLGNRGRELRGVARSHDLSRGRQPLGEFGIRCRLF